MKKMHFFLLLLSAFLTSVSFGQDARYKRMVFSHTDIQTDITYGSGVTQSGTQQDLKLDIYQPADDTLMARPLIVLAHGGYFLFGNKETMAADADSLARAGFVVAAINYRLIDIEESAMAYKRAVVDAVSDMKAAVRFFRKDASESNLYRIDTSNIFIGGFSAGAITSLHYAYASTADDVYAIGGSLMLRYLAQHGGPEGDSGNPGYSSRVKGVINISGSLHHAGLLDAGEPVLFSVHGTDDDVVPFHKGVSGQSEVQTEGSGLIHRRAAEVGLTHKLIAVEGGDHLAFFLGCSTCRQELRNFLHANID